MKHSILYPALIVSAFAFFSLQSYADTPFPRPAFMPSTPPATKAISAYTAAEMVGAVTTLSSQFSAGHPYDSISSYLDITKTWPGAKDKMQIDAMVQIVLDAPAAATHSEIDDSFENVRYVIQEVMDVSDADKADAFVRIVNAQTDPLKRKRAAAFAWAMFPELLDARLLAFEKERLDDATEYTEQYTMAEGKPPRKSSIRADAKRSILWELQHTLKLTIDATPFKTADEAANCAALKAWLTTNLPQIEAKCAQVKLLPDRRRPTVIIHPWDARW